VKPTEPLIEIALIILAILAIIAVICAGCVTLTPPPDGADTTRKFDAAGRPNFGPQK